MCNCLQGSEPNARIAVSCYVLQSLVAKRRMVIPKSSKFAFNPTLVLPNCQVVSGDIVKEMLSEAIDKYKVKETKLITDGGPENVNTTVEKFLELKEDVVEHLVAGKDITFSNSLVEAVNKICKYGYLYKMSIFAMRKLRKCIRFFVEDYNNIRPHGSLKSHTPQEYLNQSYLNEDKWKKDMEEARADRIEKNKSTPCGSCEGIIVNY